MVYLTGIDDIAVSLGGPLAGAGAFAGVGMALDPQIHKDIAERDWQNFLDHSSYHLPLIGSGRSAWDAAQEGKPWHVAGHAALSGLEAAGLRAAWLRGAFRGTGAGKVRWDGKDAKLLESRFPNAAKKFAQHAKDFTSVSDVGAFYKRALALADSKIERHIFSFTSKGGTTFKMNSKTGEFLVINPIGKISTFYRREKDALKYWEEQIAKYGKK